MIEDKKFLTAKDIFEKEFKIDARGYRPQEVDKFLDMVIKDYVEYEKLTKRLIADLKNIENENARLKTEARSLKEKLDIANSASNKNVTNVDIIKRISELEKVVYGE